jgi:hypothetical protein
MAIVYEKSIGSIVKVVPVIVRGAWRVVRGCEKVSRDSPILFEKIVGALFPQTFREKCATKSQSPNLTG